MPYRLDEFWLPRLGGIVRPQHHLPVAGWEVQTERNPFFVEADLNLREDFGGLNSRIWLVAAPGAVGKSTLAREMSARTGAVYLDLARADAVAGYYLTGGLERNGLSGRWVANETTVLIDALDEARMRTRDEAFRHFLSDVLEKSHERRLPTILFGRLGVIEEAQTILFLEGVECPVFDIDFFDQPQATAFVMGALQRLKALRTYEGLAARLETHRGVYQAVAKLFVEKLADATAVDDSRFSGYAPVLEAVANVLAGVKNAGDLQREVPKSLQQRVLRELTDRILRREGEKLREQLTGDDWNLHRHTLYLPEDQLARLMARIFGIPEPPMPADLAPQLAASYEEMMLFFIEQHPFLDGKGRHQESGRYEPSSAVFDAVMTARALRGGPADARQAALLRAGLPPRTPNPFLIDFYLDSPSPSARDREPEFVAPEQIVLLHEAMQARAGARQVVQLSIEGDDDDEEADVELLEIDIEVDNLTKRPPKPTSFRTSQAGVLHFTRKIHRVSIDAPLLDVRVGSGSEMEIVAPVSINVARLTFDCPRLVVSALAGSDDATVSLEARELRESKILHVPAVRGSATLQVAWPGAEAFPWTNFRADAGGDGGEEADIRYALGRLRKIIMAFQAHGRGRLARFSRKIEHARMMKGPGEAILRRLREDEIISLNGPLYFLDSDLLGKVAGANYHDLKLRQYNQRVRDYIATIIQPGG